MEGSGERSWLPRCRLTRKKAGILDYDKARGERTRVLKRDWGGACLAHVSWARQVHGILRLLGKGERKARGSPDGGPVALRILIGIAVRFPGIGRS